MFYFPESIAEFLKDELEGKITFASSSKEEVDFLQQPEGQDHNQDEDEEEVQLRQTSSTSWGDYESLRLDTLKVKIICDAKKTTPVEAPFLVGA